MSALPPKADIIEGDRHNVHLDCSVPTWQTRARRSLALLSVIKVILIVAAVVFTTAHRTYAAHSGADRPQFPIDLRQRATIEVSV